MGYFHHSEDGWVYRKHRELLSLSKGVDVPIDFEGWYKAAKQEGREKRRQDIAEGLAKRSETRSEPRDHIIVTSPDTQVKSADMIESQHGLGPIRFNTIVERPGAISKPGTIKKAKVLNAPKFLR